MKKLLAFVLAVIMLVPMCLTAVAATNVYGAFYVDTSASTTTYNPDRQVSVILSVKDIAFGTGDGISTFTFDLHYNPDMVTPVSTAVDDSDGDNGDFTKLMGNTIAGWEGFGAIDTEKGIYSLGFSDYSGNHTVCNDDELLFRIHFKVKSDAKVDDIVFKFENVIAKNKTMTSSCQVEIEDIVVRYRVQPGGQLAKLPEEAIPLHVAGYRHDINNFVYYTAGRTNVNKFIEQYCDDSFGQDKLSTFAILIAGLDGIITHVDTTVGANSDKSSLVIPSHSYIIGVNMGNAEDFNYFKQIAKIGQQVTIYNVNIEGVGKGNEAVDLNRAGFVISVQGEEPPFVGGDIPDIGDDDTSDDDNTSGGNTDTSDDDNDNTSGGNTDTSDDDDNTSGGNNTSDDNNDNTSDDNTSGDNNTSDDDNTSDGNNNGGNNNGGNNNGGNNNGGNTDGGNTDGGNTDGGNTEDDSWMLGDVNNNKKIDMTDYILLKRAYFGTYNFDAGQKKRGDCNKNGKIDMTDYILLKRAYFGTYNLSGK